MGINDQLATDITTLAVRVAQFSKGESRKIIGNLEELGRDLERQIRDVDFETTTPARQQARIKSLSRDVNESIRLTYFGDGGNSETLQATLGEVGPFTQTGAANAIDTSIGGSVAKLGLNPTEMRVLTRDPVVLGNTAREHWAKQDVNLRQSFVRAMRLGIAQGETNDQLVQRVRGTRVKGQTEVVEIDGKKTKVPVRTGGIMNVSRREAEALVRSSTQTVANTTLSETYKANQDIIKGVAVLVTLDGSTTRICMSLSGGRWNIVTGDPLPDSVVQEPYPGAPPYHWSALPGDSLVETEQGPRRIDEIQLGDMVLTDKGRYRPCYAVHRKPFDDLLVKIDTGSGRRPLRLTPEHPVAVGGRTADWGRADSIRPGEYLYAWDGGQDQPGEVVPAPDGHSPFATALAVGEEQTGHLSVHPEFEQLASGSSVLSRQVPAKGAYRVARVGTVRLVRYTGDVYNLSIVGDETYVADGILVHNCRTVIAPITRSWDELARGTKGRVTKAVTNPTSTRASMDGEAPGKMTYDGFLRRKEQSGPEFANSVLGKGRADLWRQGKIELSQLTDEHLRVLSLTELRALAN